MDLIESFDSRYKKGAVPSKIYLHLNKFLESYREAITENGHSIEEYKPILEQLLELIFQQIKKPYQFETYHRQIRTPIDYYQFGLDLLRPLVIFEESRIAGLDNLKKIITSLNQGDNVILLSNHQTEPDPQAIGLLLEKTYSDFAQKMIFVAGHRVTTDPLAIPFSMGCNLLCIYSKKYIEHPPEKKEEKLRHNSRTMKQMLQLLNEGGKCIYVAPSGGRDRPDSQGNLEIAKFDPKGIELFRLMAKQAERPTHFYTLSIVSYNLLPPPNSTEKELGEKRHAQCTPLHMAFGNEIDMDGIVSDIKDKRQKLKTRAELIWTQVKEDYNVLVDKHKN